jgi:hypothetical protein
MLEHTGEEVVCPLGPMRLPLRRAVCDVTKHGQMAPADYVSGCAKLDLSP